MPPPSDPWHADSAITNTARAQSRFDPDMFPPPSPASVARGTRPALSHSGIDTQPSSEARLGLCPGPPAPSLPPPSTKLGQYTCAPRLHRTFARHTLAARAAVTWSLTIPLACDCVERWCGKEGGKEEDRGGPRSRGLGHAAAHRLCPLCHSPHHHTSHPATGRHGGAPSDPQTMEGLEEA